MASGPDDEKGTIRTFEPQTSSYFLEITHKIALSLLVYISFIGLCQRPSCIFPALRPLLLTWFNFNPSMDK